jgi:hypothetical protein
MFKAYSSHASINTQNNCLSPPFPNEKQQKGADTHTHIHLFPHIFSQKLCLVNFGEPEGCFWHCSLSLLHTNALTLTQLSNPETSKSVEEEKSVIALRVKCILLLSFDDLSVLKY